MDAVFGANTPTRRRSQQFSWTKWRVHLLRWSDLGAGGEKNFSIRGGGREGERETAEAAAMEDEARDKILVTYPLHLLNFDKDEFTADVVNAVMEISLSKFAEMETYATRLLKITNTESQEALKQGLAAVFEKFLSKFVEEDLAPWEAYCKEVCFQIPPDLVLPEKSDGSSDVRKDEDANLDAELNSLRGRKASAGKEVAELRRHIKALAAHVEAKAGFMDAFDQLQNLPLIDDLGTGVRELRKRVEEANALRAQRYQRLFPTDPSASGESGQGSLPRKMDI